MSFKTLLTAAAITTAAFLSSCTQIEGVGDDYSRNQTIAIEMNVPLEPLETRTCVDVKNATSASVGFLWQPGDKIGVYTKDGSEKNIPFTNPAIENVASAKFEGAMSGTPYYAYYPYSADNDGVDITKLKGKLLAEQPFDPNNGTIVCDYKYGKCTNRSGAANKFSFNQLFTMLRVTVDATDTDLEGERLSKIVLKVVDANGNGRDICGDFTFNAKTGVWSATNNLSNEIVMPWTERPDLVKGRSYMGFISIMPTVKKGDQLIMEVVTEAHKATFTATIKVDFQQGYIYDLPLKLKTFEENEDYGYKQEEVVRPEITRFEFKVANNSGKLLDKKLGWSSRKPSTTSVTTYEATVDSEKNEITLTIPYLYNFELTPSFDVSGGTNCEVKIDGVPQVSEKTIVDFAPNVIYSITNSEGGSRDYTVKITNTGLPVVVVNMSKSGDFSKKTTGGFLGFGATTLNQFVDFWVRGKDTDWVEDDQITVYNPDGSVDCEVTGGVRLRGNTTQAYPKKPFAIKFNDKKSVLGMPEHKRWVLLANWLDHSMIRNSVAFDIAHAVEYAWRENPTIGEGIPWTVHGQNVELVVISQKDNKAYHVGNYFLCEQIKIDKNRVNIQKPYDVEKPGTDDYTLYGHLFEVDNNYDEKSQFKTSKYSVPFMFKDEVTSGILNSVKTKIQGIETNIYNGNYDEAFKNLDINSVVDQWLIYGLTLNREYGDPRSVYMYMDGDGMLKAGSVWVFDRGTFQNQENAKNYGNSDRVKPDNEWMCWRTTSDDNYIWYKQLIKSPTFQAKVVERWKVIKPYLEMVVSQIDYYGQTQAVSYSYDSAMWPTNKADVQAWKSGFKDWSGDEQISDWNQLIANFKTVYQERLAGMDGLITSGKFTK